jgi:3-hydroxyisobutyrate dehydrogenase-like beta-hydroxyacid dehydrogenase
MIGHIMRRQFSTIKKKSIGMIGIGNMGFPMMKNLLKHGHSVMVLDTVKEKLERAKAEGASTARDVAELARDKDVCITILPTSEIVKQIWMGENGIYANAKKGSLVIDSSTVSPDTTRELVKAGEEIGLRVADVPISGGYMGARAGTLT